MVGHTYINAALPLDANVAAVSAALGRFKLGSGTDALYERYEIGGRVWLSVLPDKSDHDDTPLGVRRPTGTLDRTFQRELTGFRKQGWSGAKIQRWLDQKQHDEMKRESLRAQADRTAPWADYWTEQWRLFIEDVLSSGAATKMGLLVGAGDEKGRENPVSREVTVPLRQLDARYLEEMEYDVLYWFVPRRSSHVAS